MPVKLIEREPPKSHAGARRKGKNNQVAQRISLPLVQHASAQQLYRRSGGMIDKNLVKLSHSVAFQNVKFLFAFAQAKAYERSCLGGVCL